VRLDVELDGVLVGSVVDSSAQRRLDGRPGLLSGSDALTLFDLFGVTSP
jgi:hypothetical protein